MEITNGGTKVVGWAAVKYGSFPLLMLKRWHSGSRGGGRTCESYPSVITEAYVTNEMKIILTLQRFPLRVFASYAYRRSSQGRVQRYEALRRLDVQGNRMTASAMDQAVAPLEIFRYEA